MRIGVLGAGYVGLVTGTCLAEMGNSLTVADISERKIACLREGRSPHFEPGLDELLERNIAEGRLTFTTEVAAAVRGCEAVFLAVGTPMSEDGSADLSHIEQAAIDVARSMEGPCTIIIKSTVPVGTNARLSQLLAQNTTHPFAVVSNPEFLKEGAAVDDFLRPDRVVVGVRDAQAEKLIRRIYAPFVRNGHPIMVMDPESAEMVKYASNAMLASRISFMNEMANVCTKVGADIELVRKGVGSDRRIGGAFLFPGLGYGGSCFPKDVRALSHVARSVGVQSPICDAVDAVNVGQRLALLPVMLEKLGDDLRGKTIRKGDGLALFYWSGNRDEEVFDKPFEFRVDRDVKKQVAFGHGVHLCLGMHLARMEIRALFAELLPRLKSIELAGEPKNTRANFVSGLKSLPVRFEFN